MIKYYNLLKINLLAIKNLNKIKFLIKYKLFKK